MYLVIEIDRFSRKKIPNILEMYFLKTTTTTTTREQAVEIKIITSTSIAVR